MAKKATASNEKKEGVKKITSIGASKRSRKTGKGASRKRYRGQGRR